jgi:hypothetical protein
VGRPAKQLGETLAIGFLQARPIQLLSGWTDDECVLVAALGGARSGRAPKCSHVPVMAIRNGDFPCF